MKINSLTLKLMSRTLPGLTLTDTDPSRTHQHQPVDIHTHAPSFTSAMLFFTVLLNFLCCHGYRHSGLNISRQFAFVKGSVYSGFQLRLCATPSTSSAAQLFRQTHTHTDIVHVVLKATSQIPTQVRGFHMASDAIKHTFLLRVLSTIHTQTRGTMLRFCSVYSSLLCVFA